MNQTPGSIYTVLCFFREKYANVPLIIVEGQTDKNLIFGKLIKKEEVAKVIVAGNKKNALEVDKRSLTEKSSLAPMICVVDADYDRFTGRDRQSNIVVYSDANDMECTILTVDDILSRVETELLPSDVIQSLLQHSKCATLKDLVVNRAYEIGKYRAINQKHNLAIDFKPHSSKGFTDFYDPPLFQWCDGNFRAWLSNNSKNHSEKLNILYSMVDQLTGTVNKIDFCRGHDVLEVLARIQNNYAGPVNYATWTSIHLESVLRLNVEEDKLRSTQMAKRILEILS